MPASDVDSKLSVLSSKTIAENIDWGRVEYDYAARHWRPLSQFICIYHSVQINSCGLWFKMYELLPIPSYHESHYQKA